MLNENEITDYGESAQVEPQPGSPALQPFPDPRTRCPWQLVQPDRPSTQLYDSHIRPNQLTEGQARPHARPHHPEPATPPSTSPDPQLMPPRNVDTTSVILPNSTIDLCADVPPAALHAGRADDMLQQTVASTSAGMQACYSTPEASTSTCTSCTVLSQITSTATTATCSFSMAEGVPSASHTTSDPPSAAGSLIGAAAVVSSAMMPELPSVLHSSGNALSIAELLAMQSTSDIEAEADGDDDESADEDDDKASEYLPSGLEEAGQEDDDDMPNLQSSSEDSLQSSDDDEDDDGDSSAPPDLVSDSDSSLDAPAYTARPAFPGSNSSGAAQTPAGPRPGFLSAAFPITAGGAVGSSASLLHLLSRASPQPPSAAGVRGGPPAAVRLPSFTGPGFGLLSASRTHLWNLNSSDPDEDPLSGMEVPEWAARFAPRPPAAAAAAAATAAAATAAAATAAAASGGGPGTSSSTEVEAPVNAAGSADSDMSSSLDPTDPSCCKSAASVESEEDEQQEQQEQQALPQEGEAQHLLSEMDDVEDDLPPLVESEGSEESDEDEDMPSLAGSQDSDEEDDDLPPLEMSEGSDEEEDDNDRTSREEDDDGSEWESASESDVQDGLVPAASGTGAAAGARAATDVRGSTAGRVLRTGHRPAMHTNIHDHISGVDSNVATPTAGREDAALIRALAANSAAAWRSMLQPSPLDVLGSAPSWNLGRLDDGAQPGTTFLSSARLPGRLGGGVLGLDARRTGSVQTPTISAPSARGQGRGQTPAGASPGPQRRGFGGQPGWAEQAWRRQLSEHQRLHGAADGDGADAGAAGSGRAAIEELAPAVVEAVADLTRLSVLLQTLAGVDTSSTCIQAVLQNLTRMGKRQPQLQPTTVPS